jgi:hypothetical protein
MIGKAKMPNLVWLQSALPPYHWFRLATETIASAVPIWDPGIVLVQTRGGFESRGYIVTLESALRPRV